MRQGDFFRWLRPLPIAGAGALLALAAASLVGGLGTTTTVEQFLAAPTSAATGAAAASNGPLSIEEIFRLDAPGVVEISAGAYGAGEGRGYAAKAERSRPLGSGFVIDKAGHILTNSSVIAGVRSLEVSFSGNDQVRARVVGVDPATGVAVLQIDARSRALTPLPLGDSDDVEVGDLVVAIGNPHSFTRTATAGIVSAVQRPVDPTASSSAVEHGIETDAQINIGNSGGPLINASGEVIGVNAPAETSEESGGLLGMGFAIPIDTAEAVVAQLLHEGKVEHAFLGVSAVPLSRSVARIFNLPSARGLLVQAVVPGSGASRAGLRVGSTAVVVAGESYRLGGDIIVAADGEPITSDAQLRDVIEALAPGDRLRLELWRARREETVVVRLGRPPG